MPSLRNHNELPDWMQARPYILTGYRVGYDLKMALRSVFTVHNETANVWTHFLPLLVMLPFSWHLHVDVIGLSAPLSHHLLFLLFVIANWMVFIFSSTYHTVCCVSHRYYVVSMALDYWGISVLLVASFVPSIYFAFACHRTWQISYLVAISMLGSVSLAGPLFPIWDDNDYKWLRIGAYTITGASGLVPAVHTFLVWPATTIHAGVMFMFLFYATGIVFYLSRFPECLFPGRFDYVLNSHNIWHVCVAAAAFIHFFTCVGIYQRFTTLSAECPA